MSKAKSLRLLKVYREQGEISEDTYKNVRKWLTRPEYAPWRDQVMAMIRPVALNDAFYRIIPFGTGGRRGTVGVGTNRINERTIAESAQGLANHILRCDRDGALKKRGVIIGYDVRPTSEAFAAITAEVIAASGIQVHLFDGPRPTPMLSFAIRRLGCVAGVIITASHNPPSDNGFKAYWEDGGQLVPPTDKQVLDQVRRVRTIARMPLAEARKKRCVKKVLARVDEAYFADLKRLAVARERSATVVYSPLHGTGAVSIPRALADLGFKRVHMPAPQVIMDGTFPTIQDNYPNPEVPAAMRSAVELGAQVQADIVMASDPDADRLGVFAPDRKGGFVYLTGNQVGAMLCHFVLDRLRISRRMPPKPFIITTLVSTRMTRAIAASFGVELIDDLLVGFKWMAQVLDRRERRGDDMANFVFAFEESIGFLRGASVRDKDAAAGASTAAQLAAWCRARRMTLLDYLDSLYAKYGYFREAQYAKFLRGSAGSILTDRLMASLRQSPPAAIGGLKVHAVIDRQSGLRRQMATGKTTVVSGATGNVLVFELDREGYSSVTVRPSGTEPKVKHYVAAYGKPAANMDAVRRRVDMRVAKLIAATEVLEESILSSLAR